MSPGPVEVPAAVLADLPPIHHRSKAFRRILDESADALRELVGTKRPVSFIASSGTGGMEALLANATRAGERVLVVSGGKFGDRWAEIARSYGRGVSVARVSDGAAIPVDETVERVRREKPDAVALTHVESSTGSLAPIREIAARIGPERPIVLVDAISSIGVEELDMDGWGIDGVVGASQKALGAPPGVCFAALSERAAARATRDGLYYFDLSRYSSESGGSLAPFTPAVQTMQVAHRSLAIMREIGFETVRARHRSAASCFSGACAALGLRLFPETPASAVQVLRLPEGCGSEALLAALEERGFVAASGQGALSGSVIRTGFLGVHGRSTLGALVAALGDALGALGFASQREAALREMARFAEKEALFAPHIGRGR